MMSHRMWWLLAEALKFGESPAGLDASVVEAGFPLSHPRARLISPTPASPALKVRVFIVCSPFCVVLLVRPFSQCQQGRSGVTGGGRAAHRWKCLRDLMGVGRTARTDLATDSGVEPAGRIAARRTAVTLGDLETVTTPGPHATAGLERRRSKKRSNLSPRPRLAVFRSGEANQLFSTFPAAAVTNARHCR